MQRTKVIYRPEAIADLKDIYRIVAGVSRSHEVASDFVDRIMARCRKIGNAPHGGAPRDDLEPGLRTVPFERRAVIEYRAEKDVEILNVFYGG
ncbi:type II toxin-antitoxin system RelE/ParE family toxin [Agrobacterium sp.]|uniref:type II toxin-antitoxin system RelE/ParE family toxin n=1 Tax=Agrobacterium sp. TaxID=361 RepID=UPI0028A61130|nr:type II toxin-antitoxin system RelE/ParE family toxin [Agrobacterium sp.]